MQITHIITGLGDGGAEAVLYRLCTYETSHQHAVISLMDEGKYGPMLRSAGIAVHCLNMPRGRVTIAGLARLWRLLRHRRPDAVQTWMYHADLLGGLAARLAGIRTVVWGIHNTNLEPGKSRPLTIVIAKLLALLSRWVPARIAACAQSAAAVHVAMGYVAQRMIVIPNGYNLHDFAPDTAAGAALRTEWGIAADSTLLGLVGRFDPQKDIGNLLQSLAILRTRLESLQCILIGTGLSPNNAELQAVIASLGLHGNVRLLGRRSDVPAVMNALDVFVLSSSAEAFPNVLAEAMACGTPCVTTDVGDAAVIVGDTGWVVPARNPSALADAIEAALRARQQPSWPARQQAARQRIEQNFSLARMAESYRRVWDEAATCERTLG